MVFTLKKYSNKFLKSSNPLIKIPQKWRKITQITTFSSIFRVFEAKYLKK